MSDTETLIK